MDDLSDHVFTETPNIALAQTWRNVANGELLAEYLIKRDKLLHTNRLHEEEQ